MNILCAEGVYKRSQTTSATPKSDIFNMPSNVSSRLPGLISL